MAQNDNERYLWGIAPVMDLEEFEKAITAYKDKAVEEAVTKKLYELDEAGNQYSKKTDYNAGAAHVGDLVKTQIAQLKGE